MSELIVVGASPTLDAKWDALAAAQHLVPHHRVHVLDLPHTEGSTEDYKAYDRMTDQLFEGSWPLLFRKVDGILVVNRQPGNGMSNWVAPHILSSFLDAPRTTGRFDVIPMLSHDMPPDPDMIDYMKSLGVVALGGELNNVKAAIAEARRAKGIQS